MAQALGPYTIEMLEAFPREGKRYEILDGVLIVTPTPRPAPTRTGPTSGRIPRSAAATASAGESEATPKRCGAWRPAGPQAAATWACNSVGRATMGRVGKPGAGGARREALSWRVRASCSARRAPYP